MEGAPKQEAVEGEKDYDREAVREAAEAQLCEMLESIEVDESIPEKFHTVASLEQLLKNLDSEETDNSLRHVARIAEEKLSDELGNMSQRDFVVYQGYRLSNSEELSSLTV